MNTELKANRTITMSMEGWRMLAVLANTWNLKPSRAIEAAIKAAHGGVVQADQDYQAYLQKHGDKLPHQKLEKVASFPFTEVSKN